MMNKVQLVANGILQNAITQKILTHVLMGLRWIAAPAAPSPAHQTSEAWRSDIDGLRAVAVLAVIFYHAFPKKIQGGFVGVDIFFVISGFLISRIIMSALDKGTFTFLDFYTRRIRRIFPALFLVLAFTALIGYYYLLPPELMPLGLNMVGGAFFFSNFVSWSALGGYFKPDAELTPLLHLWSLGIEEQFYLLWPLLLVVRKKFALNLLTILCVLFGLSFYQNIHAVHKDASLAFYWPHTRFWELFAGALLAYVTLYHAFVQTRLASLCEKFSAVEAALNRLTIKAQKFVLHLVFAEPPLHEPNPITPAQWRDMASILGALLLAFSIFRIKSAYAFPGFWAMLPVAGSFILLATGPRAFINRTILSARIMVFVGTISYPLYLWHWPLLSFSKILITDHPSSHWRITLLATAALLAWLTTITLEKYIRFGGRRLQKAGSVLAGVALCAGIGGYYYQTKGLNNNDHHPPIARILKDYVIYKYYSLGKKTDDAYFPDQCYLIQPGDEDNFIKNHCLKTDNNGRKKVFLVGDSFSQFLNPGLRPFLEAHQLDFTPLSTQVCSVLFLEVANFPDGEKCAKINRFRYDTIIKNKPDILIIFLAHSMWEANTPKITVAGQAPSSYAEYLRNKIRDFKMAGIKNIVLVGEIPMWNGLPGIALRDFIDKGATFPTRLKTELMNGTLEFDDTLRKIYANENVTYISLKDALCNDDGCLTRVGNNLETDLITYDNGHLTKAGADYVAQKAVIPVIDKILEHNKIE